MPDDRLHWILVDGYDRTVDIHYVRDALIAAQEGRCGICGEPFKRTPWGEFVVANIDHVLARKLGGFDGPGNMIATHRKCNSIKGHRLPTGCETIWLLAVCERLDIPMRLTEDTEWRAPAIPRRAA